MLTNLSFCQKSKYWSKFKSLKQLGKWLNISHNISIFDQNFNFWPEFQFLTEISIFDQNFHFLPKFWFLTEISIFYRNFDFWLKFRFFTEILIFYRNFDFLPKFRFFTEISIFYRNFDFWPKVRFLIDYFKPWTSPIEAHSAPNPSFFASSRTPEIGHDFIATAWSQSGRFVFIFKSRAFLSQCKIHV